MLVDLSHSIEHGLITYDGLPAPAMSDFLSREASRTRYAPGTEFRIGRIEMVGNTGTYIDAPSHRFRDGGDIGSIDLDSIANVPAVVLRATGRRSIDSVPQDLRGKALLIHTGWSRHWNTPTYWNNQHPFLTRAAADALAQSGVRIVGIDSYNIDDTSDLARPAHTELLRAGILIVEHLTNLDALPDRGDIRFFAVPPRARGMDSFPVRAFAMV
ncbi:MAG TPA: cyclase family protein [Thermoanaerobaculia bacterium]|nr:cyclase family protein [Thermoanaerobaculia bacterium]